MYWTPANEFSVSEILVKIQTFSSKKKRLKMSKIWRQFCLGFNLLISAPSTTVCGLSVTIPGPRAPSYYSDLTLSQEFQPMAAQLSTKAALPLAKILATVTCRSSKTGPWLPYICHPRCLDHISEILLLLPWIQHCGCPVSTALWMSCVSTLGLLVSLNMENDANEMRRKIQHN